MTSDTAPASRLVGRATELDELLGRVQHSVATVLLGDAGIGKTALLEETANLSGLPVFRGGGLPAFTWMPYLTLKRALRIGGLEGDETYVVERVLNQVDRGLLVMDDLHWADPQTIALLPMMAGRIRMLAAIRTEDPGASAALTSAESAGFELVEIGPLEPEHAAKLVTRRHEQLPPHVVGRIVQRAGGNALLLEELTDSGEPSKDLELVLTARLRHLSSQARTAMAVLGLLGRPAELALLGPGADELLRAGLAQEENGRLTGRHALLAEAAASALPAAELVEIHGRLARAINDPGESARHHQAAGERALAHDKAIFAANQTEYPSERASHLRVAAECAEGESADALRLRASAALSDAGETAAAHRLLDDVSGNDPRVLATIELNRSKAYFLEGKHELAHDAIERGLTHVEDAHEPIEIDLLVARARQSWLGSKVPSRSLVEARAAMVAAEAGSRKLAEAHFGVGLALYNAGTRGAIEEFELAIRLAAEERDRDLEFQSIHLLVSVLHVWKQPKQAMRKLEPAIARARALRYRGWELELRHNLGRIRFMALGDYEGGIEELQDVLDQPIPPRDRDQVVSDLAIALSHVGRLAEARQLLDDTQTVDNAWGLAVLLWARAEMEWLAGRAAAAIEAGAAVSGPHVLAASWAANLAAAWASIDLKRSFILPDLSAELLAHMVAEGEALSLLQKSHDLMRAERLFLDAAKGWSGIAIAHELRAKWGAGEAARLGGRHERSLELLLEVEQVAADHGLSPLLARIRRSLREIGVHRSTTNRSTGDMLSSREREVLGLVGEGLTSPEIALRLGLAHSTVDSHVKSAMRKLDAKTRAQAAALARK